VSDSLIRNCLGPDHRTVHTTGRRPPNTFRILALGDSYTYGFGVAQHESLPAQLQRRLAGRDASRFLEVVNVSRPGLNLIQEWALLRQLSTVMEYDLLLLCLSCDDASPWSKHELPSRVAEWKTRWSLQWHPDDQSLPPTLTALATMVETEREAGRELAVIFYEPVTTTADLPLLVLPPICESLGVHFLDLVTPFAHFRPEDLVISAADRHPKPMAHRIAAAEIAEFLDPLLPKPAAEIEKVDQLGTRVAFFEAVDRGHGEPGELAYRHLAERAAAGSRVTPERLEPWRAALNAALRAEMAAEMLRTHQPNLSMLNEKLAQLERLLLLAVLRCSGVEPAPDLGSRLETLGEAAERTSETLREVCIWGEAASLAGAEDWPETIARARRAAEDRRRSAMEGQVRPLAQELSDFCRRLWTPARIYGHLGAAAPLTLERIAELHRRITGVGARLAALTALDDDRRRQRLLVDVRVPVAHADREVDLVCTFQSHVPFHRVFRQAHYVVVDGLTHRYELGLPEGLGGYVKLELKILGEDPIEPMMPLEESARYLERRVVAAGEHERELIPGHPIFSPFPLVDR